MIRELHITIFRSKRFRLGFGETCSFTSSSWLFPSYMQWSSPCSVLPSVSFVQMLREMLRQEAEQDCMWAEDRRQKLAIWDAKNRKRKSDEAAELQAKKAKSMIWQCPDAIDSTVAASIDISPTDLSIDISASAATVPASIDISTSEATDIPPHSEVDSSAY